MGSAAAWAGAAGSNAMSSSEEAAGRRPQLQDPVLGQRPQIGDSGTPEHRHQLLDGLCRRLVEHLDSAPPPEWIEGPTAPRAGG